MKKIFLAFFCCVFFKCTLIVKSQTTTDQEFVEMINLSRSDMKAVSDLAVQKKYSQAMEVWRDSVVNRLRRIDFDKFGWHSDRLNGKFMRWAQFLVADPAMSPSTYYGNTPPYYDYYGLSGKPGATAAINWLGKPAAGQVENGSSLSTFIMFNALPAKYWQSGDTIYLKKWFEVLSDFSARQKQLIQALPYTSQKQYTPDWSSTDAQETLDQGTRVKNILRELAVVVKNLPGETKVSIWDNVITEVRKPVSSSLAKKIPARQLANIVVSLVRDNPTILLTRYKNAGPVPNQRLNGLCALLFVGAAFPEFNVTPGFMADATTSFTDYLNTMLYKDGAMLEQSFNYNSGDVGEMGAVQRIWKTGNITVSSSLKKLLSTSINNFKRMTIALNTPHFEEPVVGNGGHSLATQIWKDDATASAWVLAKSKELTSDSLSKQIVNAYKSLATDTPRFTSVSFPYGGYNTQRNGWHWYNHYLFFNTARSARGHRMSDNNAIQVTAYGRDLLVADGQPDYYGTLASGISKYMGETSSLKVNSILVDGYSQTRQPALQSIAAAPIAFKLYHGETVDYMDGNYSQGYAAINATTAVINDVTHTRKVVFLKKMGLWLVTDLMKNSGTSSHTYTQTWNFAPWLPTKNTFGFTSAQVLTDAAKKRIYTDDPSGPNILLQHVGTIPGKKYTKYYGDSTKYLGFYSLGISTATAAADVHTEFSGTGSLALGTVIMPFKGTVTPLSLKDSSDSQNVRLSFTASTKEDVRYISGFAVNKASYFGFQLSGKSILAVKKSNGDVWGFVEGSDKTSTSWKGNVITHGLTDYAFELDSSAKTITIKAFEVPDTFNWKTGPVASVVNIPVDDVIWKQGIITGLESIRNFDSQFQVYPNPANDYLNVVVSEPGNVQVTDLKGIVLLEMKCINNAILPVDHLAQGIYFVKYSNDKSVKINRFIKE